MATFDDREAVKLSRFNRVQVHASDADAQQSDRRFAGGFYDRAQRHGPITGAGPGFERALSLFEERMRQRGLPGRWRHNAHGTKVNNGTIVDKDYEVTEWM